MKTHSSVLFILIGIYLIFPINSHCQNIKETKSDILQRQIVDEYNLQERCGNTCKEYFDKEYLILPRVTDKYLRVLTYENHYNMKLNKCFIKIDDIYVDNKTGKPQFANFRLRSIHENKNVGSISVSWRNPEVSFSNCKVMDTKCNSYEEWEILIKPYMEE
jgi:hypothetical protein